MSFLSARTNAGFSQAKVAKAMGVSDAAVSMWETGKTHPRASLLIKLAGLYGCTVDELLCENFTQKPNSMREVERSHKNAESMPDGSPT